MSISHWGIFPGVVWTTTHDWSCWFEPMQWDDYLAHSEKYPGSGSPSFAHKVRWKGVFREMLRP